jgi:hypothetical protein
MATAAETIPVPPNLPALAAEARVNLVRLTALLAFYGHHCWHVFLLGDPALTPDYHRAVTALVLAWGAEVLAVHLALGRGRLPGWLPHAVTVGDALLTTVLVSLGGGPPGALTVLYLLIVAAAAVRLSLPLVYVATAAAALGYLGALGHYAFLVIGAARYYGEPGLAVPRTQQGVFLLAVLTAGVLAGQTVRQARASRE